jgi:aminoglycoside phosphotransferase (APT) family kinase protein
MDGRIAWLPGMKFPRMPRAAPAETPPHARLRAERALRQLLGLDDAVRVPLVKVGEGLWRNVFLSRVDDRRLAVSVPRSGTSFEVDQRCLQETRLLAALSARSMPFEVPRVLGLVWSAGRLIAVREFVEGVELESAVASSQPWEVAGRCAAALHAVRGISPPRGFSRRASHADAWRVHWRSVPRGGIWAKARPWIESYAPTDGPCKLIHSDLMSQNILLTPSGRPAIIDWEFAMRGDPAYELAIITRGERAVYGRGDGFERLLDAYAVAGGCPLRAADVCFYELCLAARWYGENLADQAERLVAWIWEHLMRFERGSRGLP